MTKRKDVEKTDRIIINIERKRARQAYNEQDLYSGKQALSKYRDR